jgi:predicted ArsR family transcriptional regulator
MSESKVTRPNSRTRANLLATANVLAVFTDTKTLASTLGIEYQAAAERIKSLKNCGLYTVQEQQGERSGSRGARPTMYRASLKPAVSE